MMRERRRRRRRGRSILAITLVIGTIGACSSSNSEKLRSAELSEGCLINTDCQEPLVCAFRRCHNECESSRDCPGNERCVSSDRPFRVCQLDDERTCTRNSDCPPAMLCGVDGECRDQCASGRDCIPGQLCTSGTCADPEELDPDTGQLPVVPTAEGDPTTGTPCVRNSDCVAPLVCLGGLCTEECIEDRDCGGAERCEASRCVPVPTPPLDASASGGTGGLGGTGGVSGTGGGAGTGGAAGVGGSGGAGGSSDAGSGCVFNSDCAVGQRCLGGVCRCECRETRDCAGDAVCDGCACVNPAPDGAPPGFGDPCNLASDCPAPLRCSPAGQCVFECVTDVDCSPGTCCFQNQCTTGSVCEPPDAGTGGSGGADGGCTACSSNDQCDDGLWCNGTERCFAGCCQPALAAPCDSNSACIDDICDESAQTCQHVTLAPEDGDGDGQLAVVCGGIDCDDGDPNTYTGAPELCDGVDNDCNGIDDDNARRAFGPVFIGPQDPTLAARDLTSAAVVPWLTDRYLGFYSTEIDGSTLQSDLVVEVYDATGSIVGSAQTISSSAGTIELTDAVSGPDSALALYVSTVVTTQSLNYLVIDETTNVVGTAQLDANGREEPDGTWTGSDYYIGWIEGRQPSGAPFVAHVRTDGVLERMRQAPTIDAATDVAVGLWIQVGALGTRRSVSFLAGGGSGAEVTILGESGTVLAGPTTTAEVDQPVALGATDSGFVSVLSGRSAYYMDFAGVVGALPAAPMPTNAGDGDATTDGTAAMIALSSSNGGSAPRLLIGSGDVSGGWDVSVPISAPGGDSGRPNVTGFGSRFAFSFYSTDLDEVRWVQVGCTP